MTFLKGGCFTCWLEDASPVMARQQELKSQQGKRCRETAPAGAMGESKPIDTGVRMVVARRLDQKAQCQLYGAATAGLPAGNTLPPDTK